MTVLGKILIIYNFAQKKNQLKKSNHKSKEKANGKNKNKINS